MHKKKIKVSLWKKLEDRWMKKYPQFLQDLYTISQVSIVTNIAWCAYKLGKREYKEKIKKSSFDKEKEYILCAAIKRKKNVKL